MKSELIAEIGQNHNGDLDVALELIRMAHDHGADVAKFQLFDARRLFPPREKNEWFDYNVKTELTQDDLRLLAAECERIGIEFMASVFDVERIHWLEDIGVRRYKIASRSIHDHALIAEVSATGKPMIVSLGAWSSPDFPEIDSSAQVDFLYCISKYPTPLSDVNLGSVDFSRYAGFSDHTIGLTASMAALARGARIIEKHFTLDKTMYGPDHASSMTPAELSSLHHFRTELEACL
jgi:sialic acid synthase SpsE